MVLAYVTNVLVRMNMFRTRCMFFKFAKTIEFVSWGNTFPLFFSVYTFYWGHFSSPTLFAASSQQPTCSWLPFSAEQHFFLFFLSLWIHLWLAETSQQPISQTTWLKVTPHWCNHCNHWYVCRIAFSDLVFTPFTSKQQLEIPLAVAPIDWSKAFLCKPLNSK